jgi:hypothetical protein
LRIPDETLRTIRERVDLVDYIGQTVELKKQGASWKGCCPFHQEASASFDVDPKRGTFHCFGCQVQGDVFAFVEKVDGLSFPDAVRAVGATVGIEIEARREVSGGGPRRAGQTRPVAGSPGRPSASPPKAARVVEIGQAKGAKIVAAYDYTTRKGRLVYQVVRLEPKSFRQRRPWPGRPGEWVPSMKAHPASGLGDQATILYRIPELAAGLAAGDPVWICEGEKDVEALMAAEQVATTSAGGAGKWRDELAQPFKGFRGTVRIVQDRDGDDKRNASGRTPGELHARSIFESLSDVLDCAARLLIVEAQEGKDAADHLGAGLKVADFVQVWPVPEDLHEKDPATFKRLMLRRALESPEATIEITRHEDYKAVRFPLFTSGLIGVTVRWEGCVVISGEPSVAKSYVTTSTGVDMAFDGWDVFYASAEMHEKTIRSRAARAVVSRCLKPEDYTNSSTAMAARDEVLRQYRDGVQLPDSFHVVKLRMGVTIQDLVEMLVDRVTDRPTLVCIDSVSSLCDAMADADPRDPFGMAALREIVKWVTAVSDLTHGQVAFLILSEINAEGRAKGRSIDHRCDTAIAMTNHPDNGEATTAGGANQSDVKVIRTTKNWNGPTGKVGDFVLWWQLGRLSLIDGAREE